MQWLEDIRKKPVPLHKLCILATIYSRERYIVYNVFCYIKKKKGKPTVELFQGRFLYCFYAIFQKIMASKINSSVKFCCESTFNNRHYFNYIDK